MSLIFRFNSDKARNLNGRVEKIFKASGLNKIIYVISEDGKNENKSNAVTV